jgi:methylthioribose-1-phosphate isomerase
MKEIRTVWWSKNKVKLIDQTKLPFKTEILEFHDYRKLARAIKEMRLRGAPAIGVATALGIALGINYSKASSYKELSQELDRAIKTFQETRPTAVNLFWACEKMRKEFRENKGKSLKEIKKILIQEAKRITQKDIECCKRIGELGASLIKKGDSILTHCNAGALATAGYGTALGVIKRAHEESKRIKVLVDETRPRLQGARLTTWELKREGIPFILITDNMAGYFMKGKKIDLVIVGADRIARNGDVANKIGTYSIAVLAKEHKVPFYVACPTSTIDLRLSSGNRIPIEERNPKEVTHIGGRALVPKGTRAANPAFDLTPNKYVKAIITEKGIARRPYRKSLKKLFI